jgi:hypothetical protein
VRYVGQDDFNPMVALSHIDAWHRNALLRVRQHTFVEFIRTDRYPRPVGALVERGEDGQWDVSQVARWDDALEAECRYGEFSASRWNHLEWVR